MQHLTVYDFIHRLLVNRAMTAFSGICEVQRATSTAAAQLSQQRKHWSDRSTGNITTDCIAQVCVGSVPILSATSHSSGSVYAMRMQRTRYRYSVHIGVLRTELVLL
jgi:ABC-type transporter Mla maintaining outer membrane lipid asymmetry permease subunit MlaE